ncbi:hypothetical protein GM661_07820 [Iocasia frigidifontis]|uniref:Uncharacterized protein n=1 Tax=Iocasia fonsfrigidae TaxID=2682810 RepID=A0A8A7KID2_9FIRM|nr:hypothetical protein [Iocasia fonsfrigidae]QTL97894.1 hypothetical protein GM661_07820 [Iocasia fonsfrigidae]
MDYYFRIEKDDKNDSILIIPYGIYNEEVFSSEPVDVKLNNGTKIRIKMGLGAIYPYGEGGAEPSKFISVWIDKVKVISKQNLFITDKGTSLKIEITKDGYWLYKFDINWFKDEEKISSEFIPKENYPTEIDLIEYPKNKIKPKDGEIAILHCENEELKDIILQAELRRNHSYVGYAIQPPDESISIEEFDVEKRKYSTKIYQYEYSGYLRHFVADIDNDGKEDYVYALYSRTHYRDGDVYFIFDEEQVIDKPFTDDDFEIFLKRARKIFPNNWVERYLSFKNKIDPWWSPIKNPNFGLRYTCFWPFIYEDKFYFILGSREEVYNNWFAVLRIDGEDLIEELIVQKVKPNY